MSGFIQSDSLEQFFRTNTNTRLVNLPGHKRVFPALNFTCDTSITGIKLGGISVFGSSWPLVETWRDRNNVFSRIEIIIISHPNITTSPGVHEYILPSPLPISANDAVALYEPSDGKLEVYSERDSGMFPHSLYVLGPGEGDEVFSDDYRPLLAIDTGIILWNYCTYIQWNLR